MKGRSTLILFACILVLGSFIWIQGNMRMKSSITEDQRQQLFGLDSESLESITFTSTNAVVDCVKQNGIWMTGKAGNGLGRADEALMNRLIYDLNALGKSTTITSDQMKEREVDASAYGLDEPLGRIAAVDKNGTHEWLIGNKTAIGDLVYVQYDDSADVYLVSQKLLGMLPFKDDLLRDRSLFGGVISGPRRLELRGTGGFVQMVNDPKSGWQIQQPDVAPADQVKMTTFLDSLYKLRVEDFVADNVSDFSIYGLQGEPRQISLSGTDSSTRMLVLGEEIPEREGFIYARLADDTSVFALSKDAQDLVMFSIDDFRDRRVLSLDMKKISSISISKGAEQLELAQDEAGKWNITKPVRWEADEAAVQRLLKIWDNAYITDFNNSLAVSNDAIWTLEFGSASEGQTNRVEIIAPDPLVDAVRFRRSASDPSTYSLSLEEIPDSMIDKLIYKNPLVMKLNPADVQKVSFTRKGEDPQIVERKDGIFVAGGSSTITQVDSKTLEILLQQISLINTPEYVIYNASDLSTYGLDQPSILLQLSLAGTNQLGRVLLLGDETEKGFYAMVKGRDVVFLLDKNDVERLSGNIIIPLHQESTDAVE